MSVKTHSQNCPKCGWDYPVNWKGPQYMRHLEALLFRCPGCSYDVEVPCNDAKDKAT